MRRFQQDEIDAMVEVLRHDGVISVPTDTVYGVCCRYDSEVAQQHLREVKNRPVTKAFPIMCANQKQIASICEIDARSEAIMDAFMPGPITCILPKKKNVPEYVNGGMDTLAIRYATSDALEQLIDTLGCPVFMTSANQSGESVCTNLEEIEKQCPLLDGMMEGKVTFGEASTIVDCSQDDIKIVRSGPITYEQIENVLKNLQK